MRQAFTNSDGNKKCRRQFFFGGFMQRLISGRVQNAFGQPCIQSVVTSAARLEKNELRRNKERGLC